MSKARKSQQWQSFVQNELKSRGARISHSCLWFMELKTPHGDLKFHIPRFDVQFEACATFFKEGVEIKNVQVNKNTGKCNFRESSDDISVAQTFFKQWLDAILKKPILKSNTVKHEKFNFNPVNDDRGYYNPSR